MRWKCIATKVLTSVHKSPTILVKYWLWCSRDNASSYWCCKVSVRTHGYIRAAEPGILEQAQAQEIAPKEFSDPLLMPMDTTVEDLPEVKLECGT